MIWQFLIFIAQKKVDSACKNQKSQINLVKKLFVYNFLKKPEKNLAQNADSLRASWE